MADWVTTNEAMWSGVGFDASGMKKQKKGGYRPAFDEKTVEIVLRLAGRGTEPLGCLSCRLEFILPGEGWRGRREEAVTFLSRSLD